MLGVYFVVCGYVESGVRRVTLCSGRCRLLLLCTFAADSRGVLLMLLYSFAGNVLLHASGAFGSCVFAMHCKVGCGCVRGCAAKPAVHPYVLAKPAVT